MEWLKKWKKGFTNLILRWKLISLPNQLIVVASILMAFGAVANIVVASRQNDMLRRQADITQRQLDEMVVQSSNMQKSLENFRIQALQASSDTYLKMRSRYSDVWAALPDHYGGLDITRESEHLNVFKRYWYVTFDEWYVTQRIGAYRDLWSGYYVHAYLRAMEKRSMRQSLCLMKNDEFRAAVSQDFVHAIEGLYREASCGEELCGEQSLGARSPKRFTPC